MQLNNEQKALVAQWVKEGCGLSEVQRRLTDQCQITLTYMDVRFLLIELGLDLADKRKSSSTPKDLSAPSAPETLPDDAEDAAMPDSPAPGIGSVKIDVDRIMRPGTLVSGTVVFSDGIRATWSLDQAGRLALGGTDKTYRPSAQDIQEFQMTLARELQKRGYA